MRGKLVGLIIYIVIGAIFSLIGAYVLVFSLKIKDSGVESKGIIYSIQNSLGGKEAYIDYTVDGIEYKKNINPYIADMYVGKEVKLYYNPNFPEQMLVGVEIIFGLAALAMGTLIFSMGIFMGIIKIKKYSTNKKLLKNGRIIKASIEMIETSELYKSKRKRPYTIICRYIDDTDGKIYYKKSENIWYNPEPIIKERGIKSLLVYLDEMNPKKYYIPLDSIDKRIRI